MILIDTPIWIDHLASSDPRVVAGLNAGSVRMHPFVLGEILLGTLRDPEGVRETLGQLKAVTLASPNEALDLIERHRLGGSGIGYVDAHLIASTLLTESCRLWTRDKRLRAVADRLGVAADVS